MVVGDKHLHNHRHKHKHTHTNTLARTQTYTHQHQIYLDRTSKSRSKKRYLQPYVFPNNTYRNETSVESYLWKVKTKIWDNKLDNKLQQKVNI